MRIIFSLLFILLFLNSFAQNIQFSLAHKISNKTPYFKILGKNVYGVYIYRYGKSEHIIEVFDEKMKLKWSKPISVDEDQIEEVSLYQEKINVIFSKSEKSESLLYGMAFDLKLRAMYRDPILLDSANENTSFKIVSSIDKENILTYRSSSDRSGTFKIYFSIFNDSYTLIRKDSLLTINDRKNTLENIQLDTSKNVLFCFLNNKGRNVNEYHLYKYSYLNKRVEKFDFSGNAITFTQSKYTLDVVNQKLIISGLYKSDKNDVGMFYVKFDYVNELFDSFIKFSKNELYNGLEVGNIDFQNFQIKRVIPRFDGGFGIVLENISTEVKTTTIPNLYGYYSTTTSTMYSYKDLLLLSIDNEGSIEWKKVLTKNQLSENDKGYYSSFALVNRYNKLHVIYNNRISSQSDIRDYVVDINTKEGSYQKLDDGSEMMLTPKYGKQISPNEIIIPSISRSYFKLVKIKF